MYSKAVTKILSSRIYAISRQEIELGNSFDSTFILFPLKIGDLNDSPGWSLHNLHKVFHFNLLYNHITLLQ